MPEEIRTKSVTSPIEEKKDGLRILATRFRGRGLPSERYDAWMLNLAPSEELLRSVLDGAISWPAFLKAYRAERVEDGPVDARCCTTIKNHGQKFTLRFLRELATRRPVSLLRHRDEDELRCLRHTLAKLVVSA